MKTIDEMNETEKREYFINKYGEIVWNPEESLEEFYDGCDGEPDWYHKGVYYGIAYADDGRKGWFVYIRDYLNEDIPTEDNWDKVPKEFFPNLTSLAFELRLLRDGRTIAEYICDYNGLERYVVPVPPSFCNNKERKQ